AAPSGSWLRPDAPRSSSPTRSRPRITRRRTPSTSCARAARSWCATSISRTSPTSCALCSATRRGSRGWLRRCCARRGRARRGRSPRSSSRLRALEGRRLWFVGIGGAGLSAYAQLARAWGAEVGGWDRTDTPYLEPLRVLDVRLELGPEPVVPAGWEAVV